MNISSYGIGAYGGAGVYSPSSSVQRSEQNIVSLQGFSSTLSGNASRRAPTQDWSQVSLVANAAVHIAVPSMPTLDSERIQGAELDDATQEFNYRSYKALREAGVNMPPNPVLSIDPDGRVSVVNGHPDKSRIEAVLNDRPDLRDRFIQLSQAHGAQRSVEGYASYQQNQERVQGDVEAQQALARTEIARNNAPFYMALGAQGAETFFGTPRGTSA